MAAGSALGALNSADGAPSGAVQNRLDPRAAARRARWWIEGSLLAIAVVLGAMLSDLVADPDALVSPLALPLAIGTAVLALRGRALWPAFLLADVVALVMADQSPLAIALAVVLRLGVLLVGATLLQRQVLRLVDLATVTRYLLCVVVLAALGAGIDLAVLAIGGPPAAAIDRVGAALTLLLGAAAGYLVVGALMLAWARPGWRRELLRPGPLVGLAVVIIAVAVGVPVAAPAVAVTAFVLAGLMAMRFGVRWGTAATAVVLLGSLIAYGRGVAHFGGATPAAQSFNVALGVAILAGGALLLGGYHEGVGDASLRRGRVTLVVATLMIACGVTAFASNRIDLERGFPFATAALFFLAGAVALGMVRGARRPTRASGRRGISIALVSGGLSMVALALFYAALPRLGVGAATGLAMTTPVFVVVLVAVASRRLPARLSIAGSAVIVGGAVTIVVAAGNGEPVGILLAVGSAVVFALFVSALDVALRAASTVDVALAASTAAAVCGVVVALVVEGPNALLLSPAGLGAIALGGIGGGAIPTLARTWSLPQIGAPAVGALGVLEPITTIAISLVLLGTGRSALQLLGICLIAVGAVASALAPLDGARRTRL